MPELWVWITGFFAFSLWQHVSRWGMGLAWQRGRRYAVRWWENRLMAVRATRPEVVEPDTRVEMPSVVRSDLVQVPSDQYQHLLEMSLARPMVTWQGVLAGFFACLLLIVVIVVLLALYSIVAALATGG